MINDKFIILNLTPKSLSINDLRLRRPPLRGPKSLTISDLRTFFKINHVYTLYYPPLFVIYLFRIHLFIVDLFVFGYLAITYLLFI